MISTSAGVAVVDGDAELPCEKAPVPDQHPLRGAALLAGGVLVLACMDTTTKYLAASHYGVPVIVAARYIVNCLLMLAILGPLRRARLVRTQRIALVLVRGAALAAASLFMALALSRMPVAESTAIVFLAPIIVVLLARPVLGEHIGPLGWVAAFAGFCGVLLIARPGSGLDPLGVIFALAAVGATAAYSLLSRSLAATETTIALLFFTALVGAIAFGLALPWFWDGRIPSLGDAVLLLSLGITSGIGHFLFTAAYRHAPASTLAPVNYVQLVWAGLLGWLVFGHVPDGLSVGGMFIIAAGGAAVAIKAPLSAWRRRHDLYSQHPVG